MDGIENGLLVEAEGVRLHYHFFHTLHFKHQQGIAVEQTIFGDARLWVIRLICFRVHSKLAVKDHI